MTTLSRERAQRLLLSIRDRHLLVLGDLMLDEYWFGRVNRISPEAPVPIVRVEQASFRLGGAGNVAANAAELGARPSLVGVLGRDAPAERFREECRRLSIDAAAVVGDGSRPTTVKTRIVAHNQQVVRCDREDDSDAAAAIEDRLVEGFLAVLATADGVVISDYGKGALTPRVLKEVLAAAQARRIPVVVDPTVKSFPAYQPVTGLTPNHHEAALATGVSGSDDEAMAAIGRRVFERLDTQSLLITRGEHGMTLCERRGEPVHIPTFAREVFDVTGAGDTVSAVFTLALSAGATLLEAATLSNHAAGVVVGKVGTASSGADEILAAFSS